MNKFLSITLALLLASSCSKADSWSYKPELDEQTYTFGQTKIIKGIDARNNQRFPAFYIKVYNGSELVGLYPGLSFTDITASKNNDLFIAISNNGLPNTALIIFDSKGNIRSLLKHYQGKLRSHYCNETVTLKRVWYDQKNPSIEFHYSGEMPQKITINSCSGKLVDIDDLF